MIKNKIMSDPNEMMTENQAAGFLKFSPKALQKWRYLGGGPRYAKISSRAVRYRKKDLVEWIDNKTIESTNQQPTG